MGRVRARPGFSLENSGMILLWGASAPAGIFISGRFRASLMIAAHKGDSGADGGGADLDAAALAGKPLDRDHLAGGDSDHGRAALVSVGAGHARLSRSSGQLCLD